MAEERAAKFLKTLNIKKTTFGGFDRISTFEKTKELAVLYEEILQEYKDRISILEREKDELKKELLAVRQAERSPEQIEEALRKRYGEHIRKSKEEAAEILFAARKESERLKENAAHEGEKLLAKLLSDSLGKRRELSAELASLSREKQQILYELRLIQMQVIGALQKLNGDSQ